MTAWPADSVEKCPVAALMPYARNARTHSDAQIAQIAGSIKEWGWTVPVLADEAGVIIAGHGRVLAAQRLGLVDVPVMVARNWTEAQKRAYTLADNKLTENGGWDTELLKLEVADLAGMGFDLPLMGFSEDELMRLSGGNQGLTDPDDVPELPAEPVTQPGDVWQLGRHRLVCGDATSADDVALALAGMKADLCLTDPPYGLGDTASPKNNYRSYDDTPENLNRIIAEFLPLAQSATDRIVLTPGNGNQWRYPRPTWTMAWFTPAGIGRGQWGFCCWQPMLCYGKDPKLAKGKGCNPDAIVHTEAAEKNGHPCAKPIKFWSWLMDRASDVGELIYDPFAGSGTTIIAAEMTGRACHALEISPVYCDVAVTRWENFTGQKAERQSANVDADYWSNPRERSEAGASETA